MKDSGRLDSRKLLIGVGLVLLVLANIGVLNWSGCGSRSPQGVPAPSLAAVRARVPDVPSLPGLELNVPLPVPGLEGIDPAYAPTLTPDLKTLVFSGVGQQQGDSDLYVTVRSSPTEPFAAPVRIDSCASPISETFPSLSPDGLELLFLRFGSRPRLFYSLRRSVDENFGSPTPWLVAEALPERRKVGGAQFIDLQYVQFVTRGRTLTEDRQILITMRSAPGSPFNAPTPLAFVNAPVPQCVSLDRLRSYFGVPSGLFVAARGSETEPFGVPVRLADLRADGPVWVTPKEDVVFFCGPSLGEPIGTSRRLWIVRY